jgi:hypothetical protein
MAPKKPTVTPIKDPTLFEMGKLEEAGRLANALKVKRPYSEPGLYLGISAFTANGWPGTVKMFWDLWKTQLDYSHFICTAICEATAERYQMATPLLLYLTTIGT